MRRNPIQEPRFGDILRWRPAVRAYRETMVMFICLSQAGTHDLNFCGIDLVTAEVVAGDNSYNRLDSVTIRDGGAWVVVEAAP